VTNISALKARFIWIFTNIKQYFVASACAFVLFIPQITYWKTQTGSFLYNGYVGERFDFLHPHIYDGLLAYNNGWLLWSPLMAISLIGIAFVYKYAKNALLPLLILFPLHTYIIYSWWCYQYINGFGSRPMEHLYPLLAFGVASFLTFMLQRKWTTALVSMLVIGGIGLNIFQTWQQGQGLIFTEMMNKGLYWGIFGQTRTNKNAIIGYATNEVQTNTSPIKEIFSTTFDDTSNTKNVMQPQNSSPMRCLTQESDTIAVLNIEDKLDADYFNIKLKNLFHADAVNGDFWSLPLIIFRFQDENGCYLCESSIKPHLLSGNTNNTIWTQGKPNICQPITWNMKIHRRSKIKKLLICTWNPLKKPFYIDDLEISLAK
jgi:hypothetical protein